MPVQQRESPRAPALDRKNGAMTEGESLVFVYGTLRKGGVRALPMLAPHSRDLGMAVIRGTLFDLGAFPGLVLGALGHALGHDAGDVVGELYEVDGTTLARLDEIEQYFPDRPEGSYYLRLPATVTQSGETVSCWTYEIRPERFTLGPRVESGDWISYFAAKTDIPEERWPDGSTIEM